MHSRKKIECVSVCQLDIEEDKVGLWIFFKPSYSFVHTTRYDGQCPLRSVYSYPKGTFTVNK